MDLDTTLLACPDCNNVFQYYDFLSHSTICNRNRNRNRNNNNNNTTFENSEIEIDSDLETENDPDSNYQSVSGSTYNGINDYGNYNALYNPMINRNFEHNEHNDIFMYDLTNTMSNININITKNKLLNNSKIIKCCERTDCSICLVSYPENTNFYLMNCNHAFCIECCEKWYSSNSLCPLCRTHYNQNNVVLE